MSPTHITLQHQRCSKSTGPESPRPRAIFTAATAARMGLGSSTGNNNTTTLCCRSSLGTPPADRAVRDHVVSEYSSRRVARTAGLQSLTPVHATLHSQSLTLCRSVLGSFRCDGGVGQASRKTMQPSLLPSPFPDATCNPLETRVQPFSRQSTAGLYGPSVILD